MAQIDTSDPREQQKFGIIAGLLLALIGGVRWYFSGNASTILFVIAAVLFVLGLAAPRALEPLFSVWMKFADGLNWVMTRVLLGVVFLVFFVPVRVVRGLFGHDALQREWQPEAETYWEDAEPQSDNIEDYQRQF